MKILRSISSIHLVAKFCWQAQDVTMANILIISPDSETMKCWIHALNTKNFVKTVKTFEQALEYKRQCSNLELIIFDHLLLTHFSVYIAKRIFRNEKCIMVGDNCSDADRILAISKGARGYAEKNLDADVVLKTIACVLQGEIWLERRLVPDVIHFLNEKNRQDISVENSHPPALSTLTQRELEVAELVYRGKSTAQIAEMLNISRRTVKAHLGAIFKKLNVTGRVELILFLKDHL